MAADYAPLGFSGTDSEFCRTITTEAKVAAVPFSPFYSEGVGTTFVRFCFCKADPTLDAAIDRLAAWFA